MTPSPCEHPLASLFAQVARGMYPPFDGLTEVMTRPPGALAAVLAFTGHLIVAADVDATWVQQECPAGDLLAAVSPSFLVGLGQRIGGRARSTTLLLVAPAIAGEPPPFLRPVPASDDHPRVQRAMMTRREVRLYETLDEDGILTIGRGLAGRWEAGIEVVPDRRGHGLGRALADAARHLISHDDALFMQVAVGNVASLRAILAAGFVPVASEVMFVPLAS